MSAWAMVEKQTQAFETQSEAAEPLEPLDFLDNADCEAPATDREARAELEALARDAHPLAHRLSAESFWVHRLYHRRVCEFVIEEHERRGDFERWDETFTAVSELVTFLYGVPHCRRDRPEPSDAEAAARVLREWRRFDVLEHLMQAGRASFLPNDTYLPAFLSVWRDFVVFLQTKGLIPALEADRILAQYERIESIGLDTWANLAA